MTAQNPSHKTKKTTQQIDFTAQLLQQLIASNTSRANNNPRGMFPAEGEPLAASMTDDDIFDAIAQSSDPWTQDVHGAQPPANVDIAMLIVAVKFAQIFADFYAINSIFKRGTATLITAYDQAQRLQLVEHIEVVVTAAQKLARGDKQHSPLLQILNQTPISDATTAAEVKRQNEKFANSVDEAIIAGRPLVIITDDVRVFSDAAQIVCNRPLAWPAITHGMIVALLEQTHSATGLIAKQAVMDILPSEETLSRLSPTLACHAFQATDTIAVAARIAAHAAAAAKPAAKLTLQDVRGLPKVCDNLHALIDDLDLWKSGKLAWADVNASTLLSGPPGTGKTMLAEALAGSANIPFISTSYTDLQKSGHLGNYLKAMSDVVTEAVAAAPCVIFFDELDSFGSRNSAASDSTNGRYMTSVINDFLQQLTRLNRAEGVIVIGATNHAQNIDPAIVRSGRFDVKLTIGHPDKNGVKDILESHLGLPNLVDEKTKNQLVGLSGADLAKVARDAKSFARRRHKTLCRDHVLAAANGAAPAGNPAVLHRIATHEAGHVVVAAMLSLPLPKLARVSPVGGVVIRDAPTIFTQDSVKLELAYCLGGRAAERLTCGDISSGSGAQVYSDLDAATDLVLNQELCWGLGRNGLAYAPIARQERRNMSPVLRSSVNETLAAAEDLAFQTLAKNRDLLEFVTQALLDERELSKAQIAMLFATSPTPNRVQQVSDNLYI
jgi:cell division protease FtsH